MRSASSRRAGSMWSSHVVRVSYRCWSESITGATDPSSPNLTPMSSLHGLTLADVLREHRRSRPERLATVDGDVRLTYAQLDERVHRLADALARGAVGESPVGPGDRVVWLGQN